MLSISSWERKSSTAISGSRGGKMAGTMEDVSDEKNLSL